MASPCSVGPARRLRSRPFDHSGATWKAFVLERLKLAGRLLGSALAFRWRLLLGLYPGQSLEGPSSRPQQSGPVDAEGGLVPGGDVRVVTRGLRHHRPQDSLRGVPADGEVSSVVNSRTRRQAALTGTEEENAGPPTRRKTFAVSSGPRCRGRSSQLPPEGRFSTQRNGGPCRAPRE